MGVVQIALFQAGQVEPLEPPCVRVIPCLRLERARGLCNVSDVWLLPSPRRPKVRPNIACFVKCPACNWRRYQLEKLAGTFGAWGEEEADLRCGDTVPLDA